jgi:hypothetical protein
MCDALLVHQCVIISKSPLDHWINGEKHADFRIVHYCELQEVMNAVKKALSEQKTSGRRMVIEEVDGSDSDNEEAKLNKKNAERSAGRTTSTASSSAAVETSAEKSAGRTSGTASSSAAVETNGLKEETASQSTPTADSTVLTRDVELNASNKSQATGSEACAAGGNDGGSQIVETPAEPLPPAVQSLKDEGNDLFRKGQYGDAVEKYSAAIQILSGHCLS